MRAVFSVRGAAVALWVLAAAPALASPLSPALSSPYGDMLHDADSVFRGAVTAGLWVVFAVTGVVLLLPGAVALTVGRVVVPANAAASLVAAGLAEGRSWAGHSVTVVAAAAAAVAVLMPAFGQAVVDAGGYGDERRFLLRPPGPALIAGIAPAWAVAAAGAATGPLLLADRRWLAGAATAAVGLPAAGLAGRALFRLARRWLVFVPAGVVMHDHMTVTQPIPLPRRGIASIGPAPADTAATDLTAQAFGLALEMRLKAPVTAAVVTGRGQSRDLSVTSVLVSPSRPAAVMATAAKRGIAIS